MTTISFVAGSHGGGSLGLRVNQKSRIWHDEVLLRLMLVYIHAFDTKQQ